MSDAADKIRQDHDRVAASIRSRKDMTVTAKQAALVRNHDRAETAMRELQQRANAEATTALRGAHRQLFGLQGASASDYRDARDRAAKLSTSSAAIGAYNEADSTGDVIMARAVAERALAMSRSPLGRLDGNWSSIVSAFAVDFPEHAEGLQTLVAGDQQQTPAEMFRYVVPKPSEISSLTAGGLATAMAHDVGPDAA